MQYFSRFLSWYLYRTNGTQASVAQFSKLKANLGLVRKGMRIGKFVEHFKAAATAYDAKSLDPVVRFLTAGRQLGYAGYMSCDTLTYLDAAGVRPSLLAKRLQREAYKFWLAGISFSVLNGLYALYQGRQQAAQSSEPEKAVEIKALQKYVVVFLCFRRGCFADLVNRARSATQVQLVSDLCDLTIPLSALGYANLDDGIVGLAGSLSSLLGVLSQWTKTV